MNCANSIFDHYFLLYLQNNAYWITLRYRLFSWWAREGLLKLAYYGTWIRAWAIRVWVDRLAEPIYSSLSYCQPSIEVDWRWGVVFGGLGMMMIFSWGVWIWLTNEIHWSMR